MEGWHTLTMHLKPFVSIKAGSREEALKINRGLIKNHLRTTCWICNEEVLSAKPNCEECDLRIECLRHNDCFYNHFCVTCINQKRLDPIHLGLILSNKQRLGY